MKEKSSKVLVLKKIDKETDDKDSLKQTAQNTHFGKVVIYFPFNIMFNLR